MTLASVTPACSHDKVALHTQTKDFLTAVMRVRV